MNIVSLVYRAFLTLVLLAAAVPVAAQLYYEPAQSGHGMTVQSVGDRYVAQWYFHDGQQTRWIASDVCHYGEPCEVWTVSASGFPATASELVEAGNIVLDRIEGGVLLTYDLYIEGVDCSQVLPGPPPPECVNPDGSGNWEYNDSFQAAGSAELELLVD